MKTKLFITLLLLPFLAQAQEVTWEVKSGDITLSVATTPIVDGLSSLTPTCGTVAGSYSIEASVPDMDGDGQRETVTFVGDCKAGPAANITISLGNNQIGVVNQNLQAACVIEFRDQFNNLTSTFGIAVE